ncbi:unnamed protein product [Miscanthus lutarioriparius]|uniref:SRP54-type proteins GTP-binding domain-containing protein n=1 Tax=Miscanthus lutarioriparius TaxID=422564 RepID=A0A811REM4_9POAL|nr:unnamed protein product [Miscanthus lutarioriparius]
MTGQEAAGLVSSFNDEIGITGAILTKLDGDSRGGAALSVKEVSGKPIKFVGQGGVLKILSLSTQIVWHSVSWEWEMYFHLLKKAQEVMCQEDAEELQKKILSAKFNFNDFLKQTQMIAQMGSFSRFNWHDSGMNKVTPAQIREAEKNLKFMESVINVMTLEERERPELLAESRERRKRVAKDSGKTEQQVSQLVAQLFQMRAKMQKMMGAIQGKESPDMDELMESMKAEEQAAAGTGRRRRKYGNLRQRQLDAMRGFRRRDLARIQKWKMKCFREIRMSSGYPTLASRVQPFYFAILDVCQSKIHLIAPSE